MESQRHALLIGVSVSPRIYQHPCLRIRADYQQLSSDRDVDLMRQLLVVSFGFAVENTRVLKTREATREAILAAVTELIGRVGRDDIVVLYYSGHGSRIPALDRETIVPFDSGRSELATWECEKVATRLCTDGWALSEVPGDWAKWLCGPRLWGGVHPPERSPDIQDVTIAGWVRELNKKTPFVTLIFDCCHSGSVSRPAGTVREAVPDLRPAGELSDDRHQPLRRADSRSLEKSGSGWLPEVRQAVVVAACHASEYAWEREEPPKHGLFTYHLHRALDRVGPKATWMDILEEVAPRVNREQLAQHPQIEGETDLYVFSREKARRGFYLPVSTVDADVVDLSGGAAHGVSLGSSWTVRSGDARSRFEGQEVAQIRVDEVWPVTCRARVVEDTLVGRLAAWQRAFLVEQSVPAPGLRVAIAAPEDRRRRLAERIAETRLLAVVENPQAELEDREATEAPDVTAVCLPPRDPVVAGAPDPLLGPLEEWTWTVVDGEGRLKARRQLDDEAGIAELVEELVRLARFRGLQHLTNPDPESRLRDQVDLRILHQPEPGSTLEVAPVDPRYGVAVVEDGDIVDFEIENKHYEKVWVSLLELDLDHSITVRMPTPEHPYYSAGGQELEPGQVLRLGRDYYWNEDGFAVSLPDGFPWSAAENRGPEVGVCHLKLMVTSVRTSFEFLEQEPTRFVEATDSGRMVDQDHPLRALACLYHSNVGTRWVTMPSESSLKDQDWAVVSRGLGIRREATPALGEQARRYPDSAKRRRADA